MAFSQQITFFYTRDLARTAQFYEQVLGLSLARDQGDCRIYAVAGAAYIGFCQRDSTPENPQGVLLTLITDEVDAWHARLVANGVEIVRPPTANTRYGIYHCFIREPNGWLIEIQRFDQPL